MATRTSVGSGLWSAVGTWGTGVPLDGDDVVIALGHTVTFDVNQSAFVTGVKITITGKLDFTTTPGSYCLKLKSDANAITGTGYLECGTEASPVPSNVKHLITTAGNATLIKTSSTKTSLVGVSPTNRVIKTTNAESAGATRLEVDTDISSDLWAIGDYVTITNNGGNALATNSCELKMITGINSGYIDISSGLSEAKEAGSHIVLGNRNVNVVHITSNRLFQGGGTFIDMSIMSNAYQGFTNSPARIIRCVSVRAVFNLYNEPNVINDSIFTLGSFATGNAIVNNSKYYGCSAVGGNAGELYNCEFYNSQVASEGTTIYGGKAEYCTGPTGNKYRCYNLDFSVGSIWTYWNVPRGVQLYNCKVGDAGAYNWSPYCNDYHFIESVNHEQVLGAFKFWTYGGITTSQTSVMPPGYNLAYITSLTSASYMGWHRHSITVPRNKSVVVEVNLRKTVSMAYLPRVMLSNYYVHLVYNPALAIDSFTMTDSIGTWESHTFTIDNTSNDFEKEYTLWFFSKNASGNVYSAYELRLVGSGGGSVKILPVSGKVGL